MLKVKNLNVSYDEELVLKDINFEIKEGNIIGIIGPNGAGKSTLIKAILGLTPSKYDEISFKNLDIKLNLKKTSYLPQRANINWHFPISVLDVVLMGVYPSNGLIKKIKKEDKLKALEAIEKVGLKNYANRPIGKLSGGQQQRVFMARALLQNSNLLFLDEPFVGIDTTTEKLIIELLKEFKTLGKTILIVHHDLSKVSNYFDTLIILNKELVAVGSVSEVFNKTNLTKAYNVNFESLGDSND